MNKALKKSIETELNLLVTKTLTTRNKKAASEIAKHIREGVKNIARKFAKHVPETEKKKKKAAGIKIAASPKKGVKKVAAKRKRTVTKK